MIINIIVNNIKTIEELMNLININVVYISRKTIWCEGFYKKYMEENEDNIEKLIYILKTDYSQKTEEASIVLNFIESIEGYENKVVVFSQLIDLLKRGGMASILKDLVTKSRKEDKDKE